MWAWSSATGSNTVPKPGCGTRSKEKFKNQSQNLIVYYFSEPQNFLKKKGKDTKTEQPLQKGSSWLEQKNHQWSPRGFCFTLAHCGMPTPRLASVTKCKISRPWAADALSRVCPRLTATELRWDAGGPGGCSTDEDSGSLPRFLLVPG